MDQGQSKSGAKVHIQTTISLEKFDRTSLQPETQRNYTEDEFIDSQWAMLQDFLADKSVKLVTIFGYGAPDTDVEAIKLKRDSWGGRKVRNMEQFEIIEIREEKKVVKQWKEFRETHHWWQFIISI